MRTQSTITTKDGISWYYEQEGSGPHVVLIPDGVGDCYEFDKCISLITKEGFTVTTFDIPGLSRSCNAPPEAYQNVTAQKLAKQIIGLMDELQIDVAAFWGSSSGGAAALALAAGYPERTLIALPHEVPTAEYAPFTALAAQDNDFISSTMSEGFAKTFGLDPALWESMGVEFHARLWNNYPRWLKGYLTLPTSVPTRKEDLTRAPAGIDVRTLSGTHFTYFQDPGAFINYFVELLKNRTDM